MRNITWRTYDETIEYISGLKQEKWNEFIIVKGRVDDLGHYYIYSSWVENGVLNLFVSGKGFAGYDETRDKFCILTDDEAYKMDADAMNDWLAHLEDSRSVNKN
jgi:hypothetical protein